MERFSIHKKSVEKNGQKIFGYGGGVNPPANGPDSRLYTPKTIYKTDANELDYLLSEYGQKVDILLLHDIKGLEEVVKKHEPEIVITGHDHEQGRETIIGTDTEWIKCGPIVPFDERNVRLFGKSCYAFIESEGEAIRIGLSYFETNRRLRKISI